MSADQPAKPWADGRSFLATIHLRKNGRWAPVHIHENHYDFSFDVNVRNDTGWLQVGGDEQAEVFLFRYHSKGPNRLHFLISSAINSARQLATDSSGHLGLYTKTTAADFWKLQPLTWSSDQVRCRFRDNLGHQVKTVASDKSSSLYLTTGAGETHEYLIVRAI